jgi:hypothetical protein
VIVYPTLGSLNIAFTTISDHGHKERMMFLGKSSREMTDRVPATVKPKGITVLPIAQQ